jgi:hypothetical protein
MFWPRYDVFLSYSRADSERVRPLCDELRRLGYRVFFDVQSIDPGEKWKDRLDRSIRASRTLILCWSENARGHEYITFEYSRAEALHKRVFPWLLDGSPLPAMLELQGITETDAAKVAAALGRSLGWTLKRRRSLQGLVAVVMAIVLAIGLWHSFQPLPPWSFQGEVTDLKTHLPIAGVEVDLKLADGKTYTDLTDSRGAYTLQNLPQPRPAHIHLQFRKQGYIGDSPIVESTQNGFDPLLEPLPVKQP